MLVESSRKQLHEWFAFVCHSEGTACWRMMILMQIDADRLHGIQFQSTLRLLRFFTMATEASLVEKGQDVFFKTHRTGSPCGSVGEADKKDAAVFTEFVVNRSGAW